MKLIIGLGNPGKEYEKTRHNAGFMVIDKLSQDLGINVDKSGYKGLYGKGRVNGEDVILLKPQTFMNLSGESVRAVMDYFKISIKDIVVVFDDLDIEIGKIRIRNNGSAGGQNGMKSIIQHLGTQDFLRIRVGIGKDPLIETSKYVLGRMSKEQEPEFEKGLEKGMIAAAKFAKGIAVDKIMQEAN